VHPPDPGRHGIMIESYKPPSGLLRVRLPNTPSTQTRPVPLSSPFYSGGGAHGLTRPCLSLAAQASNSLPRPEHKLTCTPFPSLPQPSAQTARFGDDPTFSKRMTLPLCRDDFVTVPFPESETAPPPLPRRLNPLQAPLCRGDSAAETCPLHFLRPLSSLCNDESAPSAKKFPSFLPRGFRPFWHDSAETIQFSLQ
jgi:hypothetical protein